MKQSQVIVVDIDGSFLEYVSPAVARLLVGQSLASVFCRSPYILKVVDGALPKSRKKPLSSYVQWSNNRKENK